MFISRMIIILIEKYFYFSLSNIVSRHIKSTDSILDLGCGWGEFGRRLKTIMKIKQLDGIDIYSPYVEEAAKIYDSVLCADVTKVVIDKKYDIVMLIYSIEHFEKGHLHKFENIAKRKIIVTTIPGLHRNGFDNEDGFPGIESQIHRSGYTIDEFRNLGYKVYGYASNFFSGSLYRSGKIPSFIRPLITLLSVLSTIVTYKIPELAALIICIKEKEV